MCLAFLNAFSYWTPSSLLAAPLASTQWGRGVLLISAATLRGLLRNVQAIHVVKYCVFEFSQNSIPGYLRRESNEMVVGQDFGRQNAA